MIQLELFKGFPGTEIMPRVAFFVEPRVPTMETCKTCKHRRPTRCGGRVVQYCRKISSSRTDNGMLKIKVNMAACDFYKVDPAKER